MTAVKRSGRWTVDFQFGGQRIRRVSPQNTQNGAERYERKLRARLEQGLPLDERDADQPPKLNGKGVLTFKEFSELFMQTHAAVHNGDAEQESKRGHLRAHLWPAFGRKRLDQIDLAEIEMFKARLSAGKTRRNRPRSRKTINNILGTLSKILTYAVDLGKLDRKPRIELLKTDEVAPKFQECEVYEQLVAAASSEPVWHAAILLGGDAGLRLGEIRALRASHWHGDRIRVQRAFWRDVEKGTKGKRLRTVPLSDRLQGALTRLGSGHQYLVSVDPVEALTMEEARWHLPRLCQRAGVAPIGWHVLRHTYCSHLAMAGVPARVIQELAGHQDLATTLKYMHLTEGASDRAVRALVEHRARNAGQIRDPEEKKPLESSMIPGV